MKNKKLNLFLCFIAFISLIQNTPLQAENYYWVAGSGNWSELNHWATSSGGTVFHSSVPAFDDNVIFDANSFSDASNQVFLNVENAICANLDFSGLTKNLNFGGSSTLHIHATLIMHPLVNFEFNGSMVFEANEKIYTIITQNKNFPCDITFAGTKSNWTINGTLNCQMSLSINTPYSSFLFGDVNIGGSYIISSSANVSITGDLSVSNDFLSYGTGSVFQTSGNMMIGKGFLFSAVNGNFSLGGTLTAGGDFNVSNGTFVSNGNTINSPYYSLRYRCTADLSNSNINIGQEFVIDGQYVSLTSTNTSLYLSGNNLLFQSNIPVSFNNVNFSGKGTTNCSNSIIQNLTFNNDGIIAGDQNHFIITTFAKKGELNGNQEYDNLNLTAGNEYQFEANKEQTIKNSLNATGNCGATIVLKSSLEGTQASISKSSGTVSLNYLIVQDINFRGGATFSSANYVNIQNTTGLTGTAGISRVLYWVGGTGYWNQNQHWSTTSGGAGGECIPSAVDDVVFDQNSFSSTLQYVLVADGPAFCKNIDWLAATNNPSFSNTNNNATLNIFGSAKLNHAMDNSFNANIYFRAKNTGNQIQSNGNSFNADLYFEGDGGQWTLADDLYLNSKSIYLNKGTLVSAGKKVTIQNFLTEVPTYNRSLNIIGSEVHITDGWKVTSEKFSLLASNSHIFMDKIDAEMGAGSNLTYNNISFSSTFSSAAKISGSNLIINQLHFFSKGEFNCSVSNIQNITFDGDGTINNENNLIENAEFKSNGLLLFDNTFGTLKFTPAKIYSLASNKTQTINTTLIANGNCNAPITLKSNNEGSRAFIKKLSTALTIDYIVMKDIEAISGVNYTTNNTTDLGNNIGWTINAVSPKDYYWVGGSGNWEDPNKWAFTSGGAGGSIGTCLPNQNDNVYFDQHSFSASGQIVAINSEAVSCKNMNWSGIDVQVSIMNNGNSVLNIFGSFTLSPNLTWNYPGSVHFKGNNGNFDVNTFGKKILGNVYFNGNNANWQLTSNFNTQLELNLVQGNLLGNNVVINASKFISNPSGAAHLSIDNSTMLLSSACTTGSNFTFAGNNSKIIISGNTASFSNTAVNAIIFNKIEMQGLKTKFLANNTKIAKLSVNDGSIDGTSTTIDSLSFDNKAEIKGNLAVNFGNLKSSTVISGNHNFGIMNFWGITVINMDNIFKSANFYHDAMINSNNNFDSLKLSPNHTYTLGIYRTQTVNETISLKGNNCFKIDIRSSFLGASSNISLSKGVVEGYALNIKGIKTAGGAKFYAAGPSADLGNNFGWIFGAPPGYIYGFNPDSIYLDGQIATITTDKFNTNANTTYRWSNGNLKSSLETTEPGKYVIEVIYYSEPEHCSFNDEINIHFATVKKPSCRKFTDGKITIKSDKNESYTYLWSNGSKTSAIENLTAGEYSVVITNKVSGEKAQRTFKLTEADTLKANFAQIKQPSCIGANDAELNVSISVGNKPYTYIWKDNVAELNLLRTKLANGTYELSISDSGKCEIVDLLAKIKDPEVLLMNIDTAQGISCIGDNDAKLTYAASGGTKPYIFEWNNGAKTDTIENLSVGKYSIILTDANNCTVLYDTVVIKEPDLLSYKLITKDQVCAGSNSGKIELQVLGGTKPYLYKWKHSSASSAEIDSLYAGIYPVSITDANQCETLNLSPEVKPAKAISLENINLMEPNCYNDSTGKISFQQKGGNGNLQCRIKNGEFKKDGLFTNLTAGTHLFFVKDDSSCIQEFTIELREPLKLKADYSIQHPFCIESTNGIIGVDATGGNPPYTMSLANPVGESLSEFENLGVGNYVLRLFDNKNCQFIDTILLTGPQCEAYITIPNTFTPNGDNTNDYFTITSQLPMATYSIYIYSRLGGKVFESKNITDSWDGRLNGRECNPGVYYYTLQYGLKGEIETAKGFIHLFR